jgi:hypothetical protein
MKDSTTRQYINGVKDTTTIRLYEFAPEVLDAGSSANKAREWLKLSMERHSGLAR